jgi:hypothetical protein
LDKVFEFHQPKDMELNRRHIKTASRRCVATLMLVVALRIESVVERERVDGDHSSVNSEPTMMTATAVNQAGESYAGTVEEDSR